MAKKTTTKKRSILIRDLDKQTIKSLDFFKNKNGLKTDSKAVVYMISKIESYLNRIHQLNRELELIKEKSEDQEEILRDLQIANNNLKDYFVVK